MDLKHLPEHARNLAKLPVAFVQEVLERGPRSALRKVLRFRFTGPYRYREDFNDDAVRAAIQALPRRPLFSILMPVYNVSPRWLHKAVASVQAQLYPDWELCVVDDASPSAETRAAVAALQNPANDPRIRTVQLPKNLGIAGASNHALGMAHGGFVTLLDHDDELTRDALYETARAINLHEPDLLYSDEDIINTRGRARDGHLKPDYSPDLLLAHNYITHLFVMRRDLVQRTGGFRDAFNGAQDYDLALRLVEQARRICHVRKVLYHWRSLPTSTSRNASAKPYAADAGLRALSEALQRRGIEAAVEHANLPHYYRVRRRLTQRPRISIIIPFRDHAALLDRCVHAILSKSTYTDFEILAMDNDSAEPATRATLTALCALDARVRVVPAPGPFNYSRINNAAVRAAQGEHIVLMNNDIAVITPDWIETLLEHSQRPEVGAVGARLLYANGRIQHAGIIIGIAGFAGHAHRHLDRAQNGYMNRLRTAHNISAVTGALLMVKRALYMAVGGLEEEHLGTALNDVDFCLRLRERGLLNIFTPCCEAFHYESVSRGYENTPEKRERFAREVAWFRERHRATLEQGDPYYNPGLSLVREDFAPRLDRPVGATCGVTNL